MRRTAGVVALLWLFGSGDAFAGSTMAKVKAILNGSTLKVDMRGTESTIQLHGIATPDPKDERAALKRLGDEAVDFLGEYLKDGWIYLEFPGGQPAPDKDGVIQAYVYRGKDASFVNQQLVGAGLGIVNRKVQSDHKQKLLQEEERARGASRGVWGSFADGPGKKIASGDTHQGTYIGIAAPKPGPRNDVVWFWIITYY